MPMPPRDLRSRLVGPIAFPVTPFDRDLRLDLDGLRRNLRAMLQHPPAALVAAGGTGELYSLSPAEHLEVVRTAVEECAGRVPVIAGTGFNLAIGVQLARQAQQAGADGILAFPPYYPNPDDDGLVGYYRALADATPLGLLIYSRDWFHPSPAFVERLTAIESLVGWKDGQGDIRRLQILMSAMGSRLHWIGGAGDDMVPAYYAAGIRAFTSSLANVSSPLARDLHRHAADGNVTALRPLMDALIVPLYALRARRRGHEVSVMKALMDRLDLAGGPVRPPLVALNRDEQARLDALVPAFASWNVC
jgi:5-dehydro-4-deoxyglucarate dehydratase